MGAGSAAWRLHHSLCQIGRESKLCVLFKGRVDNSVCVVPTQPAATHKAIDCHLNPGIPSTIPDRNDRRWSSLLSRYPHHRTDAEIFSDAYSELQLWNVSEVASADILHFHWIAGFVDYHRLPRIAAGRPIVWTLHDMNPFTGGCHYAETCERYKDSCGMCPILGSQNVRDDSFRTLEIKRNGIQQTNIYVVAPSQWMIDCAKESSCFKDKQCSTIKPGLNLNVFMPRRSQDLRNRIGLSGNKKLVLFGAATIENPRKGYRFLREALTIIAKQYQQDDIILGTFGKVPDGFDFGISYRVVKFGLVADTAALVSIYSAADVYVLPTLSDNLPNTLIEALACGIPLVSFKSGGVPEIIRHKETGWCAAPGNSKDLAEGIHWVISESGPWEQVSKRCRDSACTQYNQEYSAQAYGDIYDSLSIKPYRYLDGSAITQNVTRQIIKKTSVEIELQSLIVLARQILACNKFQECRDTLFEWMLEHPMDDTVWNLYIESQKKETAMLVEQGKISAKSIASPEISIIIVGGADESAVAETIEAVLLQGNKNIEIVCINKTGAEYSSVIKNRFVNITFFLPASELTIWQAGNVGIHLSRGTYISVLVAGDMPDSSWLSLAMTRFSDEPEVDVVSSSFTIRSEQQPIMLTAETFDEMLIRWPVGPYALWRTSLCRKVGYFGNDAGGDCDLWLRAARRGIKIINGEYTGCVNANEINADRLPLDGCMWRHLREKYRPFGSSVDAFDSDDILELQLAELTSSLVELISAGHADEAAKKYNEARLYFSGMPHLEKIDSLISTISKKN
jgi:glycosyltransferase involved in cell wall biosynthesis